ncbi:bifunctional 4-hydroxy-2-oxoglutarate aldolase/2-dehydro-3-deoxy-phosphogluconate aldolase [Spirulina subsalsa]|uniref:bifunctional 4-hydroxy-2-oxoglutarate aldolase/2-dehydro-3-deoxy-phosphogluconate aldolase n=1 Tax=Spirulina subsalsa TaxID=54311 RepID=UPI00037FF2E5|nr:bifunctional 4-hydroxy-2-oxoglutarate aldolase/2-dehydro-3-deoxy-phosphogluconate aldolase [Spirulina subsalsa]
MFTESWLQALRQYRVIAVLRSPSLELGVHLAEIAIAAGMGMIEITWNSDQPSLLVQHLRASFPHCWVGAGTLLTEAHWQEAIASGIQFGFSPHFNPRFVQQAKRLDLPFIPGALTPSEIVAAWQAGATCVKVFPISAMGGVSYLRAIRPPLPDIPLIPTGGVTLDNALSFLEAGAIAVGLSGQLFPPDLIVAEAWDSLQQRLQLFQTRLLLHSIPGSGR